MNKNIVNLASLGLAVASVVALTTNADAASVATPFGDPFPSNSFVIMTPTSPFQTPFGWVKSITLSGFANNTPANLGSNNYQYTDSSVQFTNDFFDMPGAGGTKVGNFIGNVDATGFVSNIYNRVPNFVASGTFNAEIVSATFEGDVFDLSNNFVGNLITRVNPDSGFETLGQAVFTGSVLDTQFVETFFDVQGQFSPDGGNNFTNTPILEGNSSDTANPPDGTKTPENTSISALMILSSLIGFRSLRRRQ